MAKLSQQLQQREAIPQRATRTQRVAQKQQYEREKKQFENLQAQAKEKEAEFEGVTSIDEYEQKYQLLDPSLQQFFETPDTLRQQKTERIEATKIQVQERLTYADQKIAEANAKYQKDLAWARERYESDKRRGKDDARERYNERKDKYEDRLDEDLAKWEGYKKGLNKGLGELNANKDVSYNDINQYADDLAQYEESREEARNERRAFERKQADEIKKLEEQGYSPQVIEKSFKGNPESVQLSYYNAKTGDWKTVATYDVKGNVNVANLEKLGYSSPQQRTLEFGGKTYQFSSRVPIYKEASGQLVTPYEKTGITEAEVIKQQQDLAYQEWQKSQEGKINLPFKVVDESKLPSGFGGQQTVSDQPKNIVLSDKQYYRDVETPIDFAWGKVKSGLNWVDERVNWDFSITGSPTFPKLSIISFGKKEDPTNVENLFDKGIGGLEDTSTNVEKWAIGEERIEEYKTGVEEKYSLKYQEAFEQKYMKGLIYGETDFETASKEFEQSKEAKIIQKKYAEEFGEGYEQLQTDVGFWRGTAGGVAQTGIGLGSLGLKSFKTPLRTVATVGAVYTGVKALQLIPPVVSYGATGGLFAYGTYKFLSPESTYIERGGGLVTAVLSGATLGYAGYKYLRSPVVRTELIKPPKATLRSTEAIGKDVKILTNQGSVNKVIFENQKLSQTASVGRRTIVTTKWRALSNQYLGTNLKNIYEGIPTAQLGTKAYFEKFGGLIKIGKQSGYQKAFNLLKDYGWSDAQAKATLRYVAPRVTEQYLSRGVLTIKGNKAIGEFEYLTKRPVIDVDKTLGIKTRGGATVKDVYNVQRKLVNLKGTNVVLEEKTKLSFILDKQGRIKDLKDFAYTRGLNLGKASDLQKGFEVKKLGDFTLYKEAQLRDIYSVSFERNLLPKDNILRIDASKTKLINKIIDIRDKGGYVKPANIKKTPFSKTFGDFGDDIANKVTRQATGSDFAKVVDKLDDIAPKIQTPPRSEFYGTGQYERTDAVAGLSRTQLKQLGLQEQLKGIVTPEKIRVTQVKDLIKIKKFDALADIDALVGVKIGQLTAIKTASALKTDLDLKSDLQLKNNLKVLIKEDIGIKVAQQPALKISPALKSQLKTLLDLGQVAPSIRSPISDNLPKIPDVKVPLPKPFVIPFLKAEISKRRGKKKGQSIYDQAYLPDFTSRALGLEAETITQKQAQARLKKLLTGLEIRRGVRVR